MTTTTSVLDALETELSPGRIEKISTQLQTNTAATSRAISMAIPILLGRLSKNASDAPGSAALDAALGAHDGDIFENISALLGGGAGAAILGHILGPRQGRSRKASDGRPRSIHKKSASFSSCWPRSSWVCSAG
jgi:hypothetical protein